MVSQLFLHYLFQVIILLKIYAVKTSGLTNYTYLNAKQNLEADLDSKFNNQTKGYIITNTEDNRKNDINRPTFSNGIGSTYDSNARIGMSITNMRSIKFIIKWHNVRLL